MQTGSVGRAARAISHNRPLLRLELAYGFWSIFEMGVWLIFVLWGYDHGGAGLAGVLAIAQYLPGAVLAPLGGMLADRLPRDVALRGSYFSQLIASIVLTVLVAVDAGKTAMIALALISSIIGTTTRPPHYAATAELSQSPGEAAAANSLAGTLERIGYFLGPMLVGIVVAATSFTVAALGCAVLSLATALLLVGVRLGRPQTSTTAETQRITRIKLLPQLAKRPSVGIIMLIVGVVFMTEGCLELLAISFANAQLGAGAGASGLLIGAEGLGGILGAVTTVVLIRWRKLSLAVAGSLAAASIPLLAFHFVHGLVLAYALLVLVGVGMGFFLVAGITLLQRSVPGGVMARILSLRESALLFGLTVGAGLSRVLIRDFGPTGAYMALGVGLIAVAVISLPAGRRLDSVAIYRPQVVELLASIEFLGVLDVPSLERLASGAAELQVPPDTDVIRQGEEGDAFYVVESGQLRVSVDGHEKSVELEAGSGFGEIALLRQVPRTATVRTITATTLWRIDRELFLETVTGSTSQDLAERYVDVQLDRMGPAKS